MSGKDLGITVKKADDLSEWYTQVVTKAQLADYSSAKGFIIVMPYGFSIWENIKAHFDRKIKEIGHQNAYFPLLIPDRLLKKEAEHFEGFTPPISRMRRRPLMSTSCRAARPPPESENRR